MCGIAGYYSVDGADQSQLKLAAAILGIEMQSRGGQSWGTIDTNGQIAKGLGPISRGITLPLVMPQTYVLHTRFGTHGDNTLANAHPFTQGNVTGVHNGVIGNHDELNAKYERHFAVDSQHIFQHINDGLLDLSDILGYGTIVYKIEGNWFFGTFNNGQLEVANTPLGKIFASTASAVENACRFAGIEILDWDVLNDNTIYELQALEAFKRFDVTAGRTASRWEDGGGADDKWWKSLSKKKDENSQRKLIGTLLSSGHLLMAPRTWETIIEEEGDNGETESTEIEATDDDLRFLNGLLGDDTLLSDEADSTHTGLECGHCYAACLPELHYVNVEGIIVCPGCAKSSYAFIAPDEYCSNENKGRFPDLTCGMCGSIHMDPIISLVSEDYLVCLDCFETHFNTKGLTKVTTIAPRPTFGLVH